MSKKMKSSVAAMLCATSLLAGSPATATVITFDDGAYTSTGIAEGYAGFNWTNMYSYPGFWIPDTGYSNGTVSGDYVAFNDGPGPGSFSSESPFTLVSMEVTKAWHSGTTHFAGFTESGLTYEMDVYATTLGPVHAVFNWYGVTRIEISDVISGPGSNQTVIDNLTVMPVPEPEAYALLFAGLGLIGFMVRRKGIFRK
jgi:hypothetical protein